jgi:hypothetical protein
MAIAAYFNLELTQFDAVNAFGNAFLDEQIYTYCAEGIEELESSQEDDLWLLIRALYGLPRSPLLWFNTLSEILAKIGLKAVLEYAYLFVSEHLVMFFYVDDIAVLFHQSNKAKYNEFKEILLNAFVMHELGELKWFLGIRVIRDRDQHKIWLCQDSYIDKLANKFGINQSQKHAKTPLETSPLLPHNGSANANQIHEYQRHIGSITYPSSAYRPDILHSSQKLAEFL